ncbi:hypothetical protein BVH35_003485 [Campylobacter fetus]|uniref:hypothetical protein n=1 Tax=Campylobacter fetus TaxID=196 RepID=UPI00112F8804|nr:hypothetical protein [Campylobacter fetus]MPB72247.1 hypothetical protein [Campylobacter fetus]MPB78222.1 hypothetical protein [Campylobacter fetus]
MKTQQEVHLALDRRKINKNLAMQISKTQSSSTNITLKINALCEGAFNAPFELSNTFTSFINNTFFIAIFFKFIKLQYEFLNDLLTNT